MRQKKSRKQEQKFPRISGILSVIFPESWTITWRGIQAMDLTRLSAAVSVRQFSGDKAAVARTCTEGNTVRKCGSYFCKSEETDNAEAIYIALFGVDGNSANLMEQVKRGKGGKRSGMVRISVVLSLSL